MGLLSNKSAASKGTIAPPQAAPKAPGKAVTAAQPKPAPAAQPPVNKADILARAKQLAAGTARMNAVNPPPPAPVEPEETEEGQEMQTSEEPAAEEPAAEEKPKRGRPKKTATTPEATPPAQPAAPAATTTQGSSRAPGANSDHNFWLLISCMPSRGFTGQISQLDVLAGTAMAEAAQFAGVDHYMLAEFSGGPKLLEAAFAGWMEQNALTGAVYVDKFTPAASAVLGLLRAHATLVIERMG